MSKIKKIKQRLDQLEAENEQLQNRVDELEAENDQLQNRVDELEEQPEVSMESGDLETIEIGTIPVGNIITSKQSKIDFEQGLEELKSDLEAQTQGVEQGKTTVQQHDTPLEQVCAMPKHIAAEQLSANQVRARHIALNFVDYATKTDKGRILRAGDLRTVLKARFGIGHSETVNRVREFLNRLGNDLVELQEPRTSGFSPKTKGEKKAKGKKIVVDEQLAYSLHQIAKDHDVVTGETA